MSFNKISSTSVCMLTVQFFVMLWLNDSSRNISFSLYQNPLFTFIQASSKWTRSDSFYNSSTFQMISWKCGIYGAWTKWSIIHVMKSIENVFIQSYNPLRWFVIELKWLNHLNLSVSPSVLMEFITATFPTLSINEMFCQTIIFSNWQQVSTEVNVFFKGH